MEFRDEAQIDQSKVRYGGSSGGRTVALGGGVGGTVLLLLLFFVGPQIGIDPTSLLQEQSQQGANHREVKAPTCSTGADIKNNAECRWPAYVTDIDDFWKSKIKGYRTAQTQLYGGAVRTGCGAASNQVGPFYCPADQTVYIDTEFMQKLLKEVGAEGGYAAEAYVIGHEYGHHVQNVTGILEKTHKDRSTGPKSSLVRSELQADCYAGVWFYHTTRNPQSLIKSVSEDDIRRILDAARAVGDDNIQQKSMGRVIQKEWTHGSSQQRQKWLRTGFESGDPRKCNTFATDDLGPEK